VGHLVHQIIVLQTLVVLQHAIMVVEVWFLELRIVDQLFVLVVLRVDHTQTAMLNQVVIINVGQIKSKTALENVDEMQLIKMVLNLVVKHLVLLAHFDITTERVTLQ